MANPIYKRYILHMTMRDTKYILDWNTDIQIIEPILLNLLEHVLSTNNKEKILKYLLSSKLLSYETLANNMEFNLEEYTE